MHTSLFPWVPQLVELADGTAEVPALHAAMIAAIDGNTAPVETWLARHPIPRLARQLVEAAIAFAAGHFRDVFQGLATLAETPAPHRWLELECLLLRHLSCLRLGKTELAQQLLRDIDTLARVLARPGVLRALGVENASQLMNKGFYRAATRALLSLEPEFDDSALFWAFRIQTLLGTSQQAMGDYEQAHAALICQERLQQQAVCANFRLTCLRRRMSLAWESEQFDEAALCWDLYQNDSAFGTLPVIHTLFLQEKLRLDLARHDHETVQRTFAEIEAHVEKCGLARSFLSLIEERAELTLRANRPREAIAILARTLDEAALRGDLSGLCAVNILQARALALLGKTSEAADTLRRALDTAEEQSFGKARVRIFLFLGVAHQALGRHAEARACILRAREAAEALGLPVQRACALALEGVVESGLPRLRPLFDLLLSVRSTRELTSYLQAYQEPLRAVVQARIAGEPRTREWPLSEAFGALLQRQVACLVVGEDFICALSSQRTVTIPIGDSPQLARVASVLMRAAVRNGTGPTTEQIHEMLWPKIPYRPWQHGHRVHSLMARVRRVLRTANITLLANGTPARYTVTSPHPLAIVQLRRGPSASPAELTPRQREFLALVRSADRITTHEVCLRMGLRRQTLHPMIQPLLAAGLVVLVRQGRGSYFVGRPPEADHEN